jgi:hypothetical protein
LALWKEIRELISWIKKLFYFFSKQKISASITVLSEHRSLSGRLEIESAIHQHYKWMVRPSGMDRYRFLLSIAGVESSFGLQNKPRLELAYTLNGAYGKKSPQLQRQIGLYGSDASCSWGPWQILYITAFELGYKGAPKNLTDPFTSIPYVIAFFNKWIALEAKTIEELAECWNHGDYRDHTELQGVKNYVARINEIYKNLPVCE